MVDELQMFKIHLIDPSPEFVEILGNWAVQNLLAALSLAAAYAASTHKHCAQSKGGTLGKVLLYQCALTPSYVHINEYSDH